MFCSSCGTECSDDANFCGGCGIALARSCGECGRQLGPNANFCEGCGAPVPGRQPTPNQASAGASPPPSAAPAPPSAAPSVPGDRGDTGGDAVRKTVTVLFCDLVGSTAFQEGVDPEAARSAMGRYFAMAQAAIEGHGGTVAKFIGDGVMALFGVPEVAEDDADRSVAAGLALQQGFGDIRDHIGERYGVDVGLRVGINTGEVVIAADDADVVGDALNTAARLEAACTPGRVLVGEDTWRLTRSRVKYEVLDEVSVKGKAEPIATFQVVEETTADETATPFVGRDAEMAALVAAGRVAFQTSTARMATVIGAPGVGKTRLASELVASLDGAQSFTLRCERAGTATFAPVADLLRQVAQIASDQSGEEAAETIASWLGDTVTDGDRLQPLLASFVGGGETRSTEELFFAARRLVEILGAEAPTVLVMDDIQWAEPLLLDLLEHLVEWVHDTPLLIVGLARPELRDIRPSLAEPGRRVEDVVSLEGLDAEATARLAAELLGAERLPADLLDRLPASTQGNPLFVRELMQMLVDDGVIAEGPRGWALTIDAGAVDVPPTIQSLLSTRVERMPVDERRVVELASVVGPDFPRGAVVAVADGWSPAQVDEAFQRLRRKEVIEPTGSYWGNEPVFRFHHVLIRDAAYRRLLKGNRAELHLRVGGWTERTASALTGEHEVAIAHHFEQAHRYRRELGLHDHQTAEAGAKAAGLLATAAERALARDDLPAAGSLALRAIECLDEDDPELAGLLLVANEALLSSGDVVGATPALERLEVLGDDDRLRQWAVCFRGQLTVLADPGLLAEAADRLDLAADRLDDLDDQAGVAKARQVRALALARLGRVGECEAELDRALTAARAADDRRRVTAVLGAAPVAALWGPSPVPRAGGRCLDVIRLLRITTGSPAVEATSVRCQAVLEALRGRFDTARSMLATARETAEEVGLRRDLMETEFYAGLVELLADEPVAAEPHLRTAYEGLGRLGIGADAGQAAAHLARALLLQGRLDEADDMAAESDALAGQNPQTGIAARSVQAEVLSAQGRHGEAAELAEEAVAIAAATDILVDHANALAALARVRAAAGESADAESAAASARSLYDQKGATVDVGLGTEVAAARAVEVGKVLTDAYNRGDWNAFDPEDIGAAVAELDRLAGDGPAGHGDSDDTRIGRILAGQVVAFRERDWEAFADAFAERFDYQSSRSGPGFGTMSTRAELIDNMRARAELGYVEFDARVVASRGENLAVARLSFATDEGIEEARLQLHELGPDGRFVRIRGFDLDDLDAAVAELDRRAAVLSHDRTPHRSAAWDRFDESIEAVNRGDVAPFAALLRPDFLYSDHRTGGIAMTHGPEEAVATAQLVFREQGAVTSYERVATRGDLLALDHQTWRQPDADPGLGYHALVITQIDPDGRLAGITLFEPEEFDLALLELDRLYLSSLRPEETRHHRALLQVIAATESGDRDQALALLTSEDLGRITYVDHGHTAAPEMGDEQMVDRLLAASEMGGTTFIRQLFRTTADLNLVEVMRRRPNGDETIRIFLQEWPLHGSVNRMHTFGPEQLDDALALFDELERRGAATASPPLANTATAWTAAIPDAYAREDWLQIEELVDEGVVVADRRTDRSDPAATAGQAVLIEALQHMRRAGLDRLHNTTTAIRGDRFALVTSTFSNDHGAAEERLDLHQVDTAGRLVALTTFDPTDVMAAVAELDRIWLDEAGREANAAFEQVSLNFQRVFSGERSLEAFFADDMQTVDHRTPGLDNIVTAGTPSSADRETHRPRWAQSWVGIQAAFASEVLASSPTCVLIRNLQTRGDLDDREALVLAVVRDGSVTRYESWNVDDRLAALARFDELERPVGALVENSSTRHFAEVARAYGVGDWERITDLIDEELVFTDRRRGPAGGREVHGRAPFIDGFQRLAEVGFTTLHAEGVAVRGDDLAIVRCRFQNDDGLFDERLNLDETSPSGQLKALSSFDVDDVAGAVAELDAKYRERLDAERGAVYDVVVRQFAALADRDAAALVALVAPDAVVIDHQSLGWGDIDRDLYIGRMTAMDPDAVSVLARVHRLSDEACVFTSSVHRSDDVTKCVHWFCVTSAGRHDRIESFAEDDLHLALARFDDLYRSAERLGERDPQRPPSAPAVPSLENTATRRMAELARRFRAGDIGSTGELLADDFVRYDRRSGIAADPSRGREAMVESFQALHELGLLAEFDPVPAAVRGDALALFDTTMAAAGGAEIRIYQLVALGDDEKAISLDLFDLEDIDSALGRLESLSLHPPANAGWAAPSPEAAAVLGGMAEVISALNRNALDELAALMPEDFRAINHVGIRWPESSKAALLEQAATAMGVSERVWTAATSIDRVLGTFMLARFDTITADPDTHAVTWRVTQYIDDMWTRSEVFAFEAYDDAVARLEQLAAGATEPIPSTPRPPVLDELSDAIGVPAVTPVEELVDQPPENVATRTAALLSHMVRHGDLDAMAEHFTSDAVTADHSRLGSGRGTARDFIDAMQTWRETWDVGQPDSGGPLQTNGDHMALMEFKFGTTGDWSIDRLAVLEVDERGRVSYLCFYDPADREAALRALAQRGTAPRPSVVPNACGHLQLAIAEAIGRRDQDELLGLFGDGWTADDRRSGPRPENNRTREQFIDGLESLGPVGYVHAAGELIATRGEAYSLVRFALTNTEGLVNERLVLDELGPDGRTARAIFFDVDDVGSAMAELDRMYAAGEGAPFRLVIEANAAISAGLNRRDTAGVTAALAPDFAQTDHRPLGWGDLDVDQVAERSRQSAEYDTVTCIDSTVHAIDERTICVDRRITRTSGGADGQVDTHYLYVAQCDRSGQWVRGDQYALDQLDEALDRFDALSASLGRDPVSRAHSMLLTNLATRTTDLLAGFEAAREPAGWIDLHTPDVVVEDRRSGAERPITGSDELMTSAASDRFGDGSRSVTNVAVRGGDLCLQDVLVRSDTESRFLLLTQVDDRGLVRRRVVFDHDAVYPAIDELEERWLDGQTRPREIARWMMAWPRQIVAGDVDVIAPMLGRDFLSTDLRPMGVVSPADQFLDLLAEGPKTFGLGLGFVTSIIDCTEDSILASYETRTTSPGSGGEIVEDALAYARFVDGLLDVYDIYAFADVQEAQERFDAWRGERPPMPATPAAEEQPWDSPESAGRTPTSAAPDAEERPRVSAERGGRAPTNRADRAARGVGFDLGEGRVYAVTDTLAVRLDDYALHRVDGSTGAGLVLSRWDDDGRLVQGQWFDEADLQEAYWQLDEWAGESVPPALWRDHVIRRWARATQQQDWDTARDLLAPDYVVRVNQLIGPDEMSGESLVRWFESIHASSTELRVATPELHAFSEVGGVVWEEFEQIDTDGFAVANGGLSVVTVRDGKLATSTRFDDDRLDDALALLEEVAETEGVADSIMYMSEPARALRPAAPKHASPVEPPSVSDDLDSVVDAWHTAVDAQDTDGIERALAADFVFVDRRETLIDPLDRAEFVERERSRARMLERLETTRSVTHATIGAGMVATIASTASQGGGLDIAWEVVAVAVTADGQLRRLEYYPADDVDRAIERLHELAGDEPKG